MLVVLINQGVSSRTMAAGAIRRAVARQGFPEGHEKELKEEDHDRDEEVCKPTEMDSYEDLSDDGSNRIADVLEGSVDQESTKSDEECDDLVMLTAEETCYLTVNNDDEQYNKIKSSKKVVPVSEIRMRREYHLLAALE